MRAGRINAAGALLFRPCRRRRGFTLLELMVVLVIISLMSALIVPKLTGPMSQLSLKTASRKISASLRYARSQAAAEKTTYVALFDFDHNRLVIINSPRAGGNFEGNNQEALESALTAQLDRDESQPGRLNSYQPPDGVRLAKGVSRDGDFTSGLFPVFFFPSGGSSGGEITVANKQGRQYRLTVDFITGTVRLAEVMGS